MMNTPVNCTVEPDPCSAGKQFGIEPAHHTDYQRKMTPLDHLLASPQEIAGEPSCPCADIWLSVASKDQQC